MKFAVAHKAATYLMVGFAYVAMTAAGGVSPAISVAGAIALVGSWWWEPPAIRFERWAWLWTAASVLALAYCGVTALPRGNFLIGGAQFLIWLVVTKAYNRRSARDWQQLYLLALLMLITGSVLNADLTYGVCFFGFVIAATWALCLFHLRREIEDNLLVKHATDRASERVEVQRILDSKRIVGKRFLAGTAVLSLVVFCTSAVAFLTLPRVGFGFFVKSRGGQALAGFSDRVKLGGHGVLKSDPTIVMRVEMDSGIGGRQAPAIHWRGVAFDHYERGEWSRSTNRAPTTKAIVDVPRPGVERHTLHWMDASTDPDELQAAGARQEVWLEPLDSDVLFGASTPHVFERAQTLSRRRPRVMLNDEIRFGRSGTLHYTVWSQLERPPSVTLRSKSGPLPPRYGVYLQYPRHEITARTVALAHQITNPYDNNYDKAVAIQNWLNEHLTYTLTLSQSGYRQDPIDYFLFERKRGHCEYFASAFAILARISGIPTRQVNGFLGGEWNEYQSYVAVRAGDAHSWAEVYFPGAGWVTFDPTPPDRRDPLSRGDAGWRSRLSRAMDTMRFQWSKWVIEYDLAAQLSLFQGIGRKMKSASRATKKHLSRVIDALPLLAGTAASVGIIVFLVRRGRRKARGPGATIKPRTRSHVAYAYDQVLKHLAKAGISRPPAMTPGELAATLTIEVAPQVRELTDLYYAAEWGGKRDPDAEARAIELVKTIRSALRERPPVPEWQPDR